MITAIVNLVRMLFGSTKANEKPQVAQTHAHICEYKLEPETRVIYLNISVSRNDRRSLAHCAKRFGITLDKRSNKLVITKEQILALRAYAITGEIRGRKLRNSIAYLYSLVTR